MFLLKVIELSLKPCCIKEKLIFGRKNKTCFYPLMKFSGYCIYKVDWQFFGWFFKLFDVYSENNFLEGS